MFHGEKIPIKARGWFRVVARCASWIFSPLRLFLNMATSAKHGGFQMVSINIGVSPNGWFIMKKPIKNY